MEDSLCAALHFSPKTRVTGSCSSPLERSVRLLLRFLCLDVTQPTAAPPPPLSFLLVALNPILFKLQCEESSYAIFFQWIFQLVSRSLSFRAWFEVQEACNVGILRPSSPFEASICTDQCGVGEIGVVFGHFRHDFT